MTNRWKPILSTLGLFCMALPQARSQPSHSPPTLQGESAAETISRSAIAGAAVVAANATTRVTATLAQTTIGPILGGTLFAGQGIWYAFPRIHPSGEEGHTEARSADPTLSIFPNPFSQSARLSFHLAQAGHISLTLYDLLGKPVRILIDEQAAAGTFSLTLQANELSSGSYTAILITNERQQTIPLQIVR